MLDSFDAVVHYNLDLQRAAVCQGVMLGRVELLPSIKALFATLYIKTNDTISSVLKFVYLVT